MCAYCPSCIQAVPSHCIAPNPVPNTTTGGSGPTPSGSQVTEEVAMSVRPGNWLAAIHAGGAHCAAPIDASASARIADRSPLRVFRDMLHLVRRLLGRALSLARGGREMKPHRARVGSDSGAQEGARRSGQQRSRPPQHRNRGALQDPGRRLSRLRRRPSSRPAWRHPSRGFDRGWTDHPPSEQKGREDAHRGPEGRGRSPAEKGSC